MIIKKDILYPPTNTPRTLHIYLPDSYASEQERYPVMYFFDGHNLYRDEDATYGKSWGLETFLQQWNRKMIVVGIECSHHGRDRLDEYSPYDSAGGFLGDIHGMGKETMDWIVRDIKPMIDRTYRTWPHREATGIAGSSMGGLMSVYAAARYNAFFSKAGCLSSAVGFCLEGMVVDILRASVETDTRVYLSWGSEESGGARDNPEDDYRTANARRNILLADAFRIHEADAYLRCQRYGGHCEADWEKLVPEFMNYLWN